MDRHSAGPRPAPRRSTATVVPRSAAFLAWCLACAPPAFATATPRLDGLDHLPRITLDVRPAKHAEGPSAGQPLRFSEGIPIRFGTGDGHWDEPEPGLARWRIRVESAQAHSLSFRFDDLHLPPGAALWLFDPQARDLQGPLAPPGPGPFWSPLIRGGDAILEVTLPAAQRDAFTLGVAAVFHGYRDIAGRSWPFDPASDSGNGASGTCQVDVACPLADAWRPQARSTVLLVIGGTTICSGTLINNTRQDDRALVLTANHCGITEANVGSVYAYFNVHRDGCGTGAYGGLMQNLRGKTLLTRARTGSGGDHTLIELTAVPPASFGAYYSGWDVSGAVPTAMAGLHHPSGDDKKISRATQPAFAESGTCIGTRCSGLLPDGFRIDAWGVVWSQGATEGGSSGSGLWDGAGRLVGVLSGGHSACVATGIGNGGVDYYARLDRAWTVPGAGLIAGPSLKQVLDPDDGNCLQLSGKSPGTANPVNCRSSGTPSTTPASPAPDPVPTAPSTPTAGTEGAGSGGGAMGTASLLCLLGLAAAGTARVRRRRGLPAPASGRLSRTRNCLRGS